MPKIIINDIFDELRDENKRLFGENNRLLTENKSLSDLLKKYRKCLLGVQTVCICTQNNFNNNLIQSLERVYHKYIRDNGLESDHSIDNSVEYVIQREEQTEEPNDIQLNVIKTEPECIVTEDIVITADNLNEINAIEEPIESNENQFNYYVNIINGSTEDNLISKDITQTKTKTSQKRKKRVRNVVKKYCCTYDLCEYRAKDNYTLNLHIRRNHTFEKPFKCPNCEKQFTGKRNLQKHISIHWSKEERQKDLDKMKKIVCRLDGCQYRCKEQRHLINHMKTFHLDQSLAKEFQCEECGKCLTSKQGLIAHINSFHSTDPELFRCHLCDFVTKHQTNIASHFIAKHTAQEPKVKCEYDGCEQYYKDRPTMKKHYRNVHLNERQFKCDWPQCEASFSVKTNYEDHKRSHFGIEQFICPFEGCGKGFVRMKSFSVHKQSHLKKYMCSWPECQKRFSLKVLLTAHINRHQNIRPFVCVEDGCGKAFFVKQGLERHLKTFHNIID